MKKAKVSAIHEEVGFYVSPDAPKLMKTLSNIEEVTMCFQCMLDMVEGKDMPSNINDREKNVILQLLEFHNKAIESESEVVNG